MPAPDASAGTGPAVDPAPPTEAEPAASAAPGPPVALAAAADIPVTGAGRGPAGRRPSLSGKGSPGEVDARRDFIGSLRAQHGAAPGERRAAVVPVVNRWSTAGFVPPPVYIGFRLFVVPQTRSGERRLSPWRTVPSASCAARPRPAPPSRRAPPRPEPTLVFTAFGPDK